MFHIPLPQLPPSFLHTTLVTNSSKCLTASLLPLQALLYYCEALTKTNLQLQKAACLALKSLEVKPSPKALQPHSCPDSKSLTHVQTQSSHP